MGGSHYKGIQLAQLERPNFGAMSMLYKKTYSGCTLRKSKSKLEHIYMENNLHSDSAKEEDW